MKKVILLFLFVPIWLSAGVICVDNNNKLSTQNGSSKYPYHEIQNAVLNATNFDTIKVAVGTYNSIDNLGKPLFIMGGYAGADSSTYTSGKSGDFNTRIIDPSLTIISGGKDSIGIILTRFDFNTFNFLIDNLTVKNNRRGIVCDVLVSWPHADYVTISNCIIENNGEQGKLSGGGIFVAGNHHRILNNEIRNNHGGRGAGISGNSTMDSIIITGNRIEKNIGYDDHAGGVYLGGYAEISHNIISGNKVENSYGWGGGVLILGTAYMSFNIIKDNYCPSYGGAVFVDEGGICYMEHELIYHNSTSLYGAGVALDNGAPGSSYVYLTNCTIVNNYSPTANGGNAVFVDVESFCEVKNCILSGNKDDFFKTDGSSLKVTYTLSEESYSGIGNIIAEPMFADTSHENFYLQSTTGRYDPITQMWIKDINHSLAIDAGDPSSAYNLEPSPSGNRINLGCYGNTIYASKSKPTSIDEILHQESKVTIYPNPIDGFFVVELNQQVREPVTVSLYSPIGQKIKEWKLTCSEIRATCDVRELLNGFYFLSVKGKGWTQIEKLVKNE